MAYTPYTYAAHKRGDKTPEKAWDALFLYDAYTYDYTNDKRIALEKTFDSKEAMWTYIREQKKLRPNTLFVGDRRPKQC